MNNADRLALIVDMEQQDWLRAMENLNESTESIVNLSAQISTSQDYALPMNIWFSLLVKEKNEEGIIKYILLAGCIAEMSKQTKPDLFLTTRKLLTWSIFAISQRSLTLIIKARLVRLIKIWREKNLFGHSWARYMLAAFKGVPPEYFGLADFYININGVACICNSQILEEIVDPLKNNKFKITKQEIHKTLSGSKHENFSKIKLSATATIDIKPKKVAGLQTKNKS